MLSKLKQVLFLSLCAGLLAYTMPSYAALTIVINEGRISGIPISIVPFAMRGVDEDGQQPADIIESDLGLSGRFETIPRSNFLSVPHDFNSVKFKDWRLIKSEVLVVGKITYIDDLSYAIPHYEIQFRLIDVYREEQLAGQGQSFIVPAYNFRKAAHAISDIIYQTLTGTAGAFNTRIAYITVQKSQADKRYLLRVADADGWGAKTILESSQPILSPAWSPNGQCLAYVSFEENRSMVFIQETRTGKRVRLAKFAGLNSAPAWSPDGNRIALTLSKDGNSEIYIFDIFSSKCDVVPSNLRRLTKNPAIDTEPSWAPDGRSLIFTSDRSGQPQIYQISAAGGKAKRLTFTGKYNARASFSPDGRIIVMITNQGNGYKVGLYSDIDRKVRQLTRSRQDESPSFAPNGEMIMYATRRGGNDVLATVSTDGQVQRTLKFQGGSVRDPAWSPLNLQL